MDQRLLTAAMALLVLAITVAGCNGDGTREAAVLQASLEEDGRTLLLGVDSCNGRLSYTVNEVAVDVVRVQVRTTDEPGGDECMDGVTVVLRDDLDDRRVIDDTTEDAIDVEPAM